jgi:hypothetical protein
MDQHLKIVAYLLIAMGALGLLFAVCILVAGVGIGGVVGASSPDQDGALAALMSGGLMMGLAVLVGVLSIPNILAGRGLLQRRPWARTLAIVLSVIGLLNFPLGTAIGAYSLWVLLNDETRRLFPA